MDSTLTKFNKYKLNLDDAAGKSNNGSRASMHNSLVVSESVGAISHRK